jgi:uncharacterized membrane protein HdeD (DUF308 family)
MNGFPVIIVGLVAGLILVGILTVIALKRKRDGDSGESNYRTLFFLGITFLSLGIIYEIVYFTSSTKVFFILGFAFIALGLSYIAIGLSNRNKWNKP